MKKIIKKTFLILGCLITFSSWAQDRKVTGQVIDEDENPLPGVSIVEEGTSNGSVSDSDGEFSIFLSENDDVILIFSFLGMKEKQIKIEDQTSLNVIMESEEFALDEVITIGYGRAKRKDVTGSVSNIGGERVAERNITQLSQALQGTMSGLMVTRSNSEPGAAANVRVRGITTIGNTNPLVVVDGVPVSGMDDVNSQDIEDITVLKDAASASIYGARAASGVILITTKRGERNEINMQYTANVGFDVPATFPETVSTQRYMEMINEYTWNDAGNVEGEQTPLFSQADIDNWGQNHIQNPNEYPMTDWVDLIVRDYAPRQNHSFTISGGGNVVSTRASINYENVEALYDNKTFERITSRVNNTFRINDYLNANIDLAYVYEDRQSPAINPISSSVRYAGIYPALWDDGRIAEGQNGNNIYARYQFGGFNNVSRNKLNGRASLEFKPWESLSFKAVVAPYLYNTKGKNFTRRLEFYTADDPTQLGGTIAGHNTTSLNEARNDGHTLTTQFLINYNEDFKDHTLDLLAGYEGFSSFNETLDAFGDNYELNNYPYLNLAPLDNMRNGGNAVETAYRSYFGRLTYDYKDKYLLQANIRYDGSSRFHPDYRWGTFPSLSAGWVITEEDFMPESSFLSYLKLKGSWGKLGNERIGNYPYQSSIGFSNALLYRGNNVVSATTAAQYYYAIHNITWENTETANFGLEAYFFNNHLMVAADYYEKQTNDMLLELEIPDYMGFENPDQNTGRMTTKGWDLEVSWRDNIGSLNYSVSGNLSDSRSSMGDLGGIVFSGSQITREGTEFNEWYGYRSDGLFQSQEEIDESPTLSGAVRPGDVKYVDISGPDGVPDGEISPDYDRVPLGGSLPRYLYGGNITMDYKGFDFSLAFQGVGQQNSRMSEQMVKPFISGWTNVPKIIDGNYWSQYNTDTQNQNVRYPRLSNIGAENNNYEMSDYWLFDGGYFRLKNVVLGYTFPRQITDVLKMKNLRIFASGTDLFSIDNYPTGWDPEVSASSYITKTYNLGISVNF